MFGSDILDIGIGVTLLFLITSLVCSAMAEILESILKIRAMHIERGVRELLADPHGEFAAQLFANPLINGLFRGEYDPAKLAQGGLWARLQAVVGGAFRRRQPLPTPVNPPGRVAGRAGATKPAAAKWMPWGARRNLPAYIPSASFARALIDVTCRGADGGFGFSRAPITIASLRASVGNLPNVQLQRAILSAVDHAQGDLAQAQKNIENWYDTAMDRVSGWYKRRTASILFAIGLLAAAILNLDVMTVAERLSADKAMRERFVAEARSFASEEAARNQPTNPTRASNPGDAVTERGASADQKTPTAAAVSTTTPAATTPRTTASAVNAPTTAVSAGSPASAATISDMAAKRDALAELGAPIGWKNGQPVQWTQLSSGNSWLIAAVEILAGWLITAFAVTLGAPFWFDVLNRFMIVRSTVKPHEKSPEEPAIDGGRKSPPPPPAGPGGQAMGAPPPSPPPPPSATNSASPPLPFETDIETLPPATPAANNEVLT